MVTALRKSIDEQRKAKTRRGLLDAAEKVMVGKGYHRTLISDIVAEAGVGQGTFYRHFGDKRHLFQELFEDFVARLVAQFDDFSAALPEDEESYRRASMEAVWKVAEQVHASGALTRLFLREGPAIDAQFEESLDEVFDQFALLARHYLEHAIAGGFARPCDAGVVSQCLVGAARRLLDLALKRESGAEEIRRVLTESVAFAFDGIGRR